jgi:hypothetical protein
LAHRQLGLRPSPELGRSRPSKSPRKKYRLLCEGRVTEKTYFLYIKQALRRTLIDVDVLDEQGVPLTLVRAAVALKREAVRDAQRSGEAGSARDQYWCIFDVDDHPNLAQAVDLAKANGIELAISNPCFELWALLHFQDQHGYLERQVAADYLKKYVADYEKRLPCTELLGRSQYACERAKRLEDEHVGAGSPKTENPSSGVWRLVEVLFHHPASVT